MIDAYVVIEIDNDVFIKIDIEDYPKFIQKKWKVLRRKSGNFYIFYINSSKKCVSIGKYLLSYKGDKKVIHKNMNGLDNRKENLIVGSSDILNRYQKPKDGHTSKYKGVFWNKREKVWIAKIYVKGIEETIGRFDSERKAAKAYNKRAKELFGLDCFLNEL